MLNGSLAFQITYMGNSCILLHDSDGTTIISDPYDQHPDGLNDLPDTLTADAVTVSHTHPDHNHVKAVKGSPMILFEPGVTQVGNIKITGLMGWEGSPEGENHEMRNVIFIFETDGAKVVQLGDSGVIENEHVLKAVMDADLVIVNIDGYVIAHAEIMPFMRRIHARSVLPAHYTMPGREVWNGAPTVDEFIVEFAPNEKVVRTESHFEIHAGMPHQILVPTPDTIE